MWPKYKALKKMTAQQRDDVFVDTIERQLDSYANKALFWEVVHNIHDLILFIVVLPVIPIAYIIKVVKGDDEGG